MERHQSLLPGGRNWQLAWSDEFDGVKLDEGKWSYRLHLMHKRHKAFSEGGAFLDGNSNLVLPLIKTVDGGFQSPHLQTGSNFMDLPAEDSYGKFTWPVGRLQEHKFLHKYGYYECRCKLPSQDGWWAAFWLQSPAIGSSLDPKSAGVEVDIMENLATDDKCAISNRIVSHNNHWNGYGSQHESRGSGNRVLKDSPDGFHVYGLDWSRDGYTYYIDGERSWFAKAPVSDREQFIVLSTECRGYRGGEEPCEELKRATLPDAFVIDYVRVFDEI